MKITIYFLFPIYEWKEVDTWLSEVIIVIVYVRRGKFEHYAQNCARRPLFQIVKWVLGKIGEMGDFIKE